MMYFGILEMPVGRGGKRMKEKERGGKRQPESTKAKNLTTGKQYNRIDVCVRERLVSE